MIRLKDLEPLVHIHSKSVVTNNVLLELLRELLKNLLHFIVLLGRRFDGLRLR